MAGALLDHHLVEGPLRLERGPPSGSAVTASRSSIRASPARTARHDRSGVLGFDLGEEAHPAHLHAEDGRGEQRRQVRRAQERAVAAHRQHEVGGVRHLPVVGPGGRALRRQHRLDVTGGSDGGLAPFVHDERDAAHASGSSSAGAPGSSISATAPARRAAGTPRCRPVRRSATS